MPQWHEKSAALPTSLLLHTSLQSSLSAATMSGDVSPARKQILRGMKSAGGFGTHSPAAPGSQAEDEDALAGMQDQSGPAQRSSPAAGGPSTAPAGDAQAPKELLRAGDVVNKGGHASDFYL